MASMPMSANAATEHPLKNGGSYLLSFKVRVKEVPVCSEIISQVSSVEEYVYTRKD